MRPIERMISGREELPPALRRLRALALCLVAAGGIGSPAGCTCGHRGNIQNAAPQLQFQKGAVADFGDVLVGSQAVLAWPVTDVGGAGVNVTSVEKEAGFPTQMHVEPQAAAFNPGGTVVLQLYFAPLAEGPEEGKVLLHTDAADGLTVELAIKGNGVKPQLAATPSPLDFGGVIVGESETLPLTVTNAGTVALRAHVEAPSGSDAVLFSTLLPGSGDGTVAIPAGGSATLQVTFAPAQAGAATASLGMRACPACALVDIPLQGMGITSLLAVQPDPIDCGSAGVPSGKSVVQARVVNVGTRPTHLTALSLATATPEFTLAGPQLPALVAPGTSVPITLAFTPKEFGTQTDTLLVQSDDPRSQQLQVPVSGYGGGPIIAAIPAALDFGVAAVGFPVKRHLQLVNRGEPDPSSSKADLTVSSIKLDAGSTGFAVVLSDGGTLPRVLKPGESLPLTVTFSPAEAGSDAGTIEVSSNDQDHPTLPIPLSGRAESLPPCSYRLSPPANPGLVFGVVQRGSTRAMDFSITNDGASDCVVGDLELDPASDPAFALVGGAVGGKILPSGKTLVGEVDFDPAASAPSPTDDTGAVDLSISAAQSPSVQILLSGRGADTCLLVEPSSIDFGNVAPGCMTNDRTFTAYNTCQGPVTIGSIAAQGDQASEFEVTAPPLPATIQPGASLPLQVQFRAVGLGPAHGTVQLVANDQASGGIPHVVALAGNGTDVTQVTDDFTQTAAAKADILFVIDSSGSMCDKQTLLSQSMDVFIKYAISQGIDYHFGVLDTDVTPCSADPGRPYCPDPGPGMGRLFPLPHTPARPWIVSPADPDAVTDAETSFAGGPNASHIVGCGGGGDAEAPFESAYLALTEPNLDGENQGFLRPDAFLSIIMVGDEDDQSSRSLQFYLNFFENVKGPGNQQMLSVSNITGGDNGCDNGTISATSAPRYMALTRATGGIHEDLCVPNFGPALLHLALTSFGGVQSHFQLSSTPDPSTIAVTVAGQQLPQDPYWSYDAVTNAIVFDPTAVPPSGTDVKVSYTIGCVK